ncbi:MAG: SCO family protein [Gammaproteobacteria bacterium]
MKTILLFICLFISAVSFAAPNTQVGTVLTPPRFIQPFELIDQEDKPFTKKQLAGHWSFLFFGFTRCTMICPPTMSMLSQMYDYLEKDKTTPLPQVILVSVDPENDMPLDMQKFVTSFNPNFIGLTGIPENITHFASQLNILYMKVKQKGTETIDHSGTILLVNPKGELAAVFSMPHDPKIIAKDYQAIIKN